MDVDLAQSEENIVDLYFPELEELSERGINSYEKPARSSRTKKDQFDKLFAFMKTHSDFTKGKTSKKQEADWNILTKELNNMGPPTYTSQRWRKVWSDYKGNKKRTVKENDTVSQLKTFIGSTLRSDGGKSHNYSCVHAITGIDDNKNTKSKTQLKDKDVNTRKVLTSVLNHLESAIQFQKKVNFHLKKSVEMLEEEFHSV